MEPYVQAIIAIVVILVFALLFWLCCDMNGKKRHIKVKEPGKFDPKYNLQNPVRLLCNLHIKRVLLRLCK